MLSAWIPVCTGMTESESTPEMSLTARFQAEGHSIEDRNFCISLVRTAIRRGDNLLLLTNNDVEQVLTMADCVDVLRRFFEEEGKGQVLTRQRTESWLHFISARRWKGEFLTSASMSFESIPT